MIIGDPEPTVTWYKGEEPLSPPRGGKKPLHITHDTVTRLHVLEIDTCDLEDGGKYTVKAVNEHGTMSASFNIIVNKADKKPPKAKAGKQGDKVEMSSTEEMTTEAVLALGTTLEESTAVSQEVKATEVHIVKVSQPEVKVLDEKPKWRRKGMTTPKFEAQTEPKPVELGGTVRLEVKLAG